MNRILTLLTLALAFAVPATAQSATAKLYAKAEGDDVLVAIQIRPDFGCWFYDEGEDVGGAPTVVTMGALEGATWSPVWFPEPKIKEDQYVGTSRIFDKKTVLYAAAKGAAAAGVDPKAVTARVVGQVCDKSQCVPWEVDLEFRSPGTEELWAGFPAEILAAASAPAADGQQGSAEGEGPRWEDVEIPTWTPMFGVDEKAKARVFARSVSEDEVELVVQVATPEHWHLYHGPTQEDMGPGLGTPTTVEVDGGNVDWGDTFHPRPFEYVQIPGDENGWLWAYEGTFHFGVRGEAYDEFDPGDVTVTLVGQSCDDATCIPVSMELSVEGEGEEPMYRAAFASWTLPERGAGGGHQGEGESEAEGADGDEGDEGGAAGGVPAADDPGTVEPQKEYGQATESKGLLGFILLSIGAGLFTLLMPCTYPMIPITISFFTKQADDNNGNVASLALVYGLGIIAIFVLIGVVAAPVIIPFALHPITNLAIGTLFVVFALALFGALTLNPPQFLMNAAGKASGRGGYVGVFLMGLTLVITSFTCTGPFVGSLLAVGAAGGGVGRVVIGMGFFGLTMATPFVLLALLPGKLSKMPSAGGWMNTLKVFMGFVELAAALKFFSNADMAWKLMWIPREVFLAAWTGIAVVASMYLFGRINLKGENPDGTIGPGRMLAGTATMLGGLYCLMGMVGYRMDGLIMNAMAPPPSYSRGLVETHEPVAVQAADPLPAGATWEAGSLVVLDDYDTAVSLAKERGLGLLVNFTGHL